MVIVVVNYVEVCLNSKIHKKKQNLHFVQYKQNGQQNQEKSDK